jgi:ATP-dependent helicase/nuclease subunit B
MNIVFGIVADGDTYPDFPGTADGALGKPVVGPGGLVDILETQLGLTGPRTNEAIRIATYASKARLALRSDPERFFASSFSKDPWATSRLLLDWRDQLVAGGWSFGATKSDRLFFADEATAIAAGYRPCGNCMRDQYKAWRANQPQR